MFFSSYLAQAGVVEPKQSCPQLERKAKTLEAFPENKSNVYTKISDHKKGHKSNPQPQDSVLSMKPKSSSSLGKYSTAESHLPPDPDTGDHDYEEI